MRYLTIVFLCFLSLSAQAALVDRGGGFIYDTVLDITWLQDTNYAYTSGYDTHTQTTGNGATADESMTWTEAKTWADQLSVYDSVRGVSYDDWRLPDTIWNDSSCDSLTWSTGYNCTGSEMGHLFEFDSSQLGLFTNMPSENPRFWSGTQPKATAGTGRWNYDFSSGYQSSTSSSNHWGAWAVRDGDVAASVVPIPAAVWLFGSALAGLGWFRRKQNA